MYGLRGGGGAGVGGGVGAGGRQAGDLLATGRHSGLTNEILLHKLCLLLHI